MFATRGSPTLRLAVAAALLGWAGCNTMPSPVPIDETAQDQQASLPDSAGSASAGDSGSGSGGGSGLPLFPLNPPGSSPRPQPPGDLAASATSHTQIGLRWSDTSDSETGVLIERALAADGPFVQVPDAGRPAAGANETKYFDAGLSPNTTYHYRVRYQFANGVSEYSPTVRATTQAAPVPTPPGPVTATALSAREISLAWLDPLSGETAILIERSTGLDGRFLRIHSADPNSTRYADTGRDASTTYYYRLRYQFSNGYSEYSAVVSATTHAAAPSPTLPAAPSGLTATAGTNALKIALRWRDNSENETQFLIERQTGNGAWTVVLSPSTGDVIRGDDPTQVYYADSGGLAAGTNYCYRVKAANSAGSSAASNSACATTPAAAAAPAAPSDLTATLAAGPKIALRWRDNSSNETQFVIERQAAGGAWTTIASRGDLIRDFDPNFVLYTDASSLAANTNYCYRVKASNSSGSSAASGSACATTPAAPTAPSAPSELTAALVSGPRINLRWRDNSDNETQFIIERQTAGGAWSVLASPATETLARDTNSAYVLYTDASSLAGGTNYCYQVKASNSVGSSAASTSACATTPAAPTTATLRFTNRSAYPLVSLFVNNTELLPGQNVLARDASIDVTIPAGSFNWSAASGYINAGQKYQMYRFPLGTGNVTSGSVSAGQTVTITINNYPLGQILTRFTNQRRIYWTVDSVGAFSTIWQAKFQPSGSYKYCNEDFATPQDPEGVRATGTVEITSYNGDGKIYFNMKGSTGSIDPAIFYEIPDSEGAYWIDMAALHFSDR